MIDIQLLDAVIAHINEKQTFRSWITMATILAITGFIGAALINVII